MEYKKFTLIKEYGDEALIKCKNCGHIFWVDACTEENLAFKEEAGCLLAVCPKCLTQEDGANSDENNNKEDN